MTAVSVNRGQVILYPSPKFDTATVIFATKLFWSIEGESRCEAVPAAAALARTNQLDLTPSQTDDNLTAPEANAVIISIERSTGIMWH